MHWYTIQEENPNDNIGGGGGCLASGAHKGMDCAGKWIHFPRVGSEFDSSPYVVICERHLAEVSRAYGRHELTAAPGELRDQPRQRGLIASGT